MACPKHVLRIVFIATFVCLILPLIQERKAYGQREFRLWKEYDRYRYLPRLPQ